MQQALYLRLSYIHLDAQCTGAESDYSEAVHAVYIYATAIALHAEGIVYTLAGPLYRAESLWEIVYGACEGPPRSTVKCIVRYVLRGKREREREGE